MTGSSRFLRSLAFVLPLLLVAGSALALPSIETFDEVVAPALPAGWSSVTLPNNPGPGWITVTDAFSAPNAAFVADEPVVSDQSLETPPFHIFTSNAQLTFQHKFDLENNTGNEAYDGVALEMSVDDGPFMDVYAAGGSFSSGGYNSTVHSGLGNPLAGRFVWSGSSQGYQAVAMYFSAALRGHSLRLRWRMGTDSSRGRPGYWLDDVRVFGAAARTFPPDETFDELAAPELPLDWINHGISGPGPGWITVAGDDGTHTVAFADDPATVSDRSLETPPFDIVANGRLSFRHRIDLESDGDSAFDGVVLEFAYGDEPFVDIVDAGGEFHTGAYGHVVVACCGNNPLGGRAAWSGATGGFQSVLVDLPAAANGQRVRLRWRMGTDSSVGRTGYELDAIHVDVNRSLAFPPDETFDELTVPELPPGWTNTNDGEGDGWIIETFNRSSPPNAAFADDPDSVVDRSLTTPVFVVGPNDQLSFRHSVDLDASAPTGAVTFDGVVLEISIGGAEFQDILAAGGSFVTGGYDHVVFASAGNPLAGRNAWGGDSQGFQDVVVNLPAGIGGSGVRMRWRMGTDNFAGGRGYALDDIHVGAPISDRIFSGDFECRSGLPCR